MKAVRINEWGTPVQIENVPQPEPGEGEVLARVRAASLNPVNSFAAGVSHVKPGDAVLNFASGDLEGRAYEILKSGGRYVTSLQVASQEEAGRRGITAASIFAQPSPEQFAETAALIDAGRLKVTVLKTFPLEEARAALEVRPAATAPGKVVLTVG